MLIVAFALISSPLPADVRAFLQRHAHCKHVMSMDYPDVTAAHRGEADVARCHGIDMQRQRLILRYRHLPAIRAAIVRREKLDS
jgi:hypothetical protein